MSPTAHDSDQLRRTTIKMAITTTTTMTSASSKRAFAAGRSSYLPPPNTMLRIGILLGVVLVQQVRPSFHHLLSRFPVLATERNLKVVEDQHHHTAPPFFIYVAILFVDRNVRELVASNVTPVTPAQDV